jgi:hypothetical protein
MQLAGERNTIPKSAGKKHDIGVSQLDPNAPVGVRFDVGGKLQLRVNAE